MFWNGEISNKKKSAPDAAPDFVWDIISIYSPNPQFLSIIQISKRFLEQLLLAILFIFYASI